MATIDDKLLDVLGKIEEHLRGNNRGDSTYSYIPSASNNESIEEKRARELKYQDMLDARINGRHLEALRYERELHQTKQEYLQKEFDKEKEGLDKLKKYKDKSIEELEKKLEQKGLSKKTEKDILEAIEHLKKMDEIQHQMTIDEREFARSQHGKNKFTELTKTVSEFSDKMVKAYKSIRDFVEPWAKADDAASKFTKTLGGTKAAMDRIRKDTLDSVATGIGVKFNMSTEELLKAQQDYLKGIGRNISIDDNSRESMAAIARISADAGVDGLGMAAQFENFGISMEKTGDHLGKMFAQASKEGLSFQKYSDNVAKNIKIAQNYSFKNGLKGLESMAKKATAIKMDMQQIANFADKVSTVEGAIETSAKLQVLGGPFAALANPMEMLNEGLNDMEGLGDRVSKMLGSFGHLDKKTGEVTVSSFDKRRLRAYAEATGQDYNSVMEQVHTQAKRGEIEKQIGSSAVASKFDKDMKELIMNTGVIKDGKVGVNVNGKFKNLEEIKESDREILKQQTQSESEDIKQIAMDLRSLVDKEKGLGKQFDAIQAEIASPFGRLLKWVHGIFDVAGIAVGILGTIAAVKGVGAVGGAITGVGSAITGLFGGGAGGSILGGGAGGSILGGGAGGGILKGGSAVAGGGSSALGGFLAGAGTAAGGAALYFLGNHLDKKTETAIAEGRMEKGGTKHTLSKTGTSAIKGAGIGLGAAGAAGMVGAGATMLGATALATGIGSALGAIGGPIGMAIGAAVVGGVVGLIKSAKAKNEVIVDNQLKDLGIERKGDYNRGKLKKIDKALQTGELSNRMRRKLIQKGDIDIVKAIDKKKEEKEAKELKKKEIKAKNKMKFGTAVISIGVAKISGIGPGFGMPNAIGKGVKKLGQGTISLIKGVKEKGIKGVFEDVKNGKGLDGNKNENNKDKSFNININGTLKLTGENGQSVDIIDELRKNPNMLRTLSNMIAKEIGYLDNGTYIN